MNSPTDNKSTVVLIAAKDCEMSIAATIGAVASDERIDEIVVVDDGSSDATAERASGAGATVISMRYNAGKGAALAAGARATPYAGRYLLVDADTGESAAAALCLLDPLMEGSADLAIGSLPRAGRKGGLGAVRSIAASGIEAACGLAQEAPLSGQRAIDGELLRSMTLAPRFGVEVAMTIDAVRAGATVVEIPVDMTHFHRGRSFAGFAHRARQGKDIMRALWSRLLGRTTRIAVAVVVTCLFLGLASALGPVHLAEKGALVPGATRVRVVLVNDPTIHSLGNPGGELRGVVTEGKPGTLLASIESGSREANSPRLIDVDVTDTAVVPAPQEATITITPRREPEHSMIEGGKFQLYDIFIAGAVTANGVLTSSTTHRAGFVDATDIAPTVLAMQDRPVPPSVAGEQIRFTEATSAAAVSHSAKLVEFYDDVRPAIITVYVTVAILVLAACAALALRRPRKLIPRSLMSACSAVAAFPLATYITRATIDHWYLGITAWSATCALAIGMIVGMSRWRQSDPLRSLRRILAATVAFVALDVLAGSNLQLGGVFGSSPTLAARFTGLGNPASIVLLTALLLACALTVQLRRSAPYQAGEVVERTSDLTGLALVYLCVAAVASLPGLGSDFGGLAAFAVCGALLFAGLSTVRWSRARMLRAAVAIPLGAAGVMAALGWLDSQRSAQQRTHIGNLFVDIRNDGLSPLWDAIHRRLDANVFGYGYPWLLAVVVFVLVMLGLVASGRFSKTLPIRSAERAGGAVALFAALFAYAINDSGIVVLALPAVFLGPYLVAQFVRHQDVEATNVHSKLEVSAS